MRSDLSTFSLHVLTFLTILISTISLAATSGSVLDQVADMIREQVAAVPSGNWTALARAQALLSAARSPSSFYVPITAPGGQDVLDWMQYIIPALGTLVLAINTRFRFTDRWAKLEATQHQLKAELWRFAVRSGAYALTQPQAQAVGLVKDSERETHEPGTQTLFGQIQIQMQEERSRTRFIDSVNSLCRDAFEDFGWGSVSTWRLGACKCRRERHTEIQPAQPKPHEELRRTQSVLDELEGQARAKRRQAALNNDENELVSDASRPIYHVVVQDYVTMRTIPALKHLKAESRRLARINGALQMWSLAVSASATIVSVRGLAQSTVLLVAAAAALQSLEKHFAVSSRLEASNRGIQEMYCMIQEWKSFDSMQRNQQANRDKLVETTERALLDLVFAATSGVSVFQGAVEDKEQINAAASIARETRVKEKHGRGLQRPVAF